MKSIHVLISGLLASCAMALPSVCAADVTTVATFRVRLSDGSWRQVYYRSSGADAPGAEASAMNACNAERRRSHVDVGDVLQDKTPCITATSAEFDAARRMATGEAAPVAMGAR